MAENTMPSLTLTPEEHETAAAVAEAPTLSLDPSADAAEAEKKKVEPVVVDDRMLTEDEKKQVDEFSKKIDITDSNLVDVYKRQPPPCRTDPAFPCSAADRWAGSSPGSPVFPQPRPACLPIDPRRSSHTLSLIHIFVMEFTESHCIPLS